MFPLLLLLLLLLLIPFLLLCICIGSTRKKHRPRLGGQFDKALRCKKRRLRPPFLSLGRSTKESSLISLPFLPYLSDLSSVSPYVGQFLPLLYPFLCCVALSICPFPQHWPPLLPAAGAEKKGRQRTQRGEKGQIKTSDRPLPLFSPAHRGGGDRTR